MNEYYVSKTRNIIFHLQVRTNISQFNLWKVFSESCAITYVEMNIYKNKDIPKILNFFPHLKKLCHACIKTVTTSCPFQFFVKMKFKTIPHYLGSSYKSNPCFIFSKYFQTIPWKYKFTYFCMKLSNVFAGVGSCMTEFSPTIKKYNLSLILYFTRWTFVNFEKRP